MKKRFSKLFLVLIILVLILSACGLNGPETTVRDFLKAQEKNDFTTMASLVVPEYQEDILNSVLMTMGLSAMIGGAESKYSELKFDTLSKDGNSATVRVQGSLEVEAMGTPITMPFDYTIPLVKINGKWLIAGE